MPHFTWGDTDEYNLLSPMVTANVDGCSVQVQAPSVNHPGHGEQGTMALGSSGKQQQSALTEFASQLAMSAYTGSPGVRMHVLLR